jgi:uncharacterized RDD family membrane protein YckC
MRLHRIALGPVRAASGVIADETERAIEAAFGGPLPEMVGRALVEQRVIERVVGEMLVAAAKREDGSSGIVEEVLRSPALERWVASPEAGRVAGAAAERVVQSPAFKRALSDVLASPEVRRALTESAAGFGEEGAEAARRKAWRADDRIETRVHRWFGRTRPAHPGFAGVASRGVALVVDAGLAQAVYLVLAATAGLLLGLAGGLDQGWLAGSLAGGGWFLVVAVYFAGFWSVTGQTPGLRLLRLRVLTRSAEPPSFHRGLLRFAGLILAIIPLGAGFLPALFDRRRRALPDYLAGTTVEYASASPHAHDALAVTASDATAAGAASAEAGP